MSVAEDTPAVAVARKREVQWLKEVLVQQTPQCRLIQEQPHNALARFLFSSSLLERRADARDALLPTRVSYDASLCRELRAVGVDAEQVRNVCRALCTASSNAVGRIEALWAKPESTVASCRNVHVSIKGVDRGVMWGTECATVSAAHLEELRRLYRMNTDKGEAALFNERVFCLLQRYEALDGPTYQCSVKRETFAVLRDDFGVTKECFASPLNRNADMYWSAFTDDRFFGSQGSFFEALTSPLVVEGGCFYANPPFVEECMARLQQVLTCMLTWPVPVTFVVVLPTWSDDACHLWLESSAHTKVHLVLLAGEHEYMDGRQHASLARRDRRYVAGFSTSCFVVQNELGSLRCALDEGKRRRLRESFRVKRQQTAARHT